MSRELTINGTDELQVLLMKLSRYGAPIIGIYGDNKHDLGWCASIKMWVSVSAAEFKISTDHDQPDPLTAVRKLCDLVNITLKSIEQSTVTDLATVSNQS